ncbi:MAG: phycobilisome protein [Actinomycetota bacterium]
MPGINCTWDGLINESDGRYLTASELQKLQQYLQTFTARSKTYEILREKSDPLVKLALKKFMLQHPEIMQKHSQRCLYDMNMTMCIMALAILRDDQQFFKECLVLWQANILAAYQKNLPCLKAYQCLQEVIKEHLPPACNQLIKPYMDVVVQALDTHPKLMATVQRGGFSK